MGINQMLIGFVCAFIFAIAMVNFVMYNGLENNSPVNIMNDSDFMNYSSDMQGQMAVWSAEQNDTMTSFDKSTIEETSASGTLVTGATFKQPTKTPFGLFSDTVHLAYTKIFGGDSNFSIVLTSFTLLIGILIAWATYKAWKGGNPD
jgi:hypothetical protein